MTWVFTTVVWAAAAGLDPSDARAEEATSRFQQGVISPSEFDDALETANAAAHEWPHGSARFRLAWAPSDGLPPPLALEAQAHGPWQLSVGLLAHTSRLDPVAPVMNTDGAWHTDGLAYAPHLARWFVEWRPPLAAGRLQLIAGTFTAGFAERLTLDTSRRLAPHGFALAFDVRRPTDLARACKTSPCPQGQDAHFVTPDFDVREVFRGLALSLEDVPLGGDTRGAAFGLVSYQSHSAYQYELLDRRVCPDDLDTCSAPAVLIDSQRTTEPGALTAETPRQRVVFTTLHDVYDEFVAAAHLEAAFANAGLTVATTGYLASAFFHDAQTTELDFQPWSRHPAKGLFGAAGADAHWHHADFDLFAEASHSFDTGPGRGGGFAALTRATWALPRHRLEASIRFYDDGFDNPFGRPISAPDEFDGQRARNELGLRLASSGQLGAAFRHAERLDVWLLPFSNPLVGPAGLANLFAWAALDWVGWPRLQPGVWFEVRNRNLASSQHGRCASGAVVFTEGEPFDCNGDLYRVALRLETRPAPGSLEVLLQTSLTWADDRASPDRFRFDVQQWLEARLRVSDALTLRTRARYLNQGVDDNTSLEQSVWAFVEASWAPLPGWRLDARYDAVLWLDERAATLRRTPNPEHRFSLEVQTHW